MGAGTGTRVEEGYIWCTTEQIQLYLDDESPIEIGVNYDVIDAKAMENDVIRQMVGYLISVYEISTSSDEGELKDIAAKLTAAHIGLARQGSTIGMDIAHWTARRMNEAWSALQRIFINQSLQNVTEKNVPLWQRLIMAKSRERSIIPSI